jgi:hypothetical protein
MSERERYPLSWPSDWKRTAPGHRRRAQFGKDTTRRSVSGEVLYNGKVQLSIADAFDRIEYELERFGVNTETVIVSTNLKLTMRGIPAGNQGEPSDPGVAVYWSRKGKAQCMAIDAYTRVADNLAAVAATLSAMRAIERHGGAQILERAFLGFAQLPERSGVNWREVLRFTGPVTPANIDAVQERFRELAKQLHPDKSSGDQEAMIELNAARVAALAELSH